MVLLSWLNSSSISGQQEVNPVRFLDGKNTGDAGMASLVILH